MRWDRDRINLSLLYFLVYASWSAWWPLFNVFLQEAGLTGIQIGIVSSIAPVMMFVIQPMWGGIADRWGRKRVLLVSLIGSAIILPGYLWIHGFGMFVIWTVLFSMLLNPIYPIADSLALDYIEEKKNVSYGYLRIWGAIGWFCGAPVAGQVSAWRGLSYIFPVAAVLLLLAVFIASRIQTKKSVEGSLDISWQNLGPVIKNRRLITFLLFILLISIGMNGYLTFYSVYMTEIGATSDLIGWAIGIQGVSELPFYLLSALIFVRYGILRTVIFTFIVITVRAFLYSSISTPTLAMFVELTHGISLALLIVASVEYINQLVPSEWRATGQSLFWAAIYGAGSLIGNLTAGGLYDYMTMQNVFRVFAWFLLAVTVLAFFFLKDRKRTANDTQSVQTG
jgi:oligosaccharide:H+ symporter